MADEHHSTKQARDAAGRWAGSDAFDAHLSALLAMMPQNQSPAPMPTPVLQPAQTPMNAMRGAPGTQSGTGETMDNWLSRFGIDPNAAYGVKP